MYNMLLYYGVSLNGGPKESILYKKCWLNRFQQSLHTIGTVQKMH